MFRKLFISFLILITAVVILLGGDYIYSQLHKPDLGKSTQTAERIIDRTAQSKEVEAVLSEVDLTPPTFLAGFDWSLPANTQITNNSGLITESNYAPDVVNNRFIMVNWKETNPSKGSYNFSRLESKLKRIAPQKALIRLEVNSSCEAPKWALNSLRETKEKSLIYWDKSYIDLTKPFINEFAKRFAANPQIIGIQLGLADGEYGESPDSCNDYGNKDGWGEFWMSPNERAEAESKFGFNPEVFEQASIANIDVYANAFGKYVNKLAFTNIGTLYTYGSGAKPYNKKLKSIAKYALAKGIGNRDGAIERWMSYTDKIYGTVFTTMPDGSCRLDFDEQYANDIRGRYWGTENEFYGNKNYVIAEGGPVENASYRFLISSLRALQMRRNFMGITDMRGITDKSYQTQNFIRYLTLVMGKQIENTPDAFVLMGERYIDPYRLKDQMDVDCVAKNEVVKVRSFGRWLSESPQNTQRTNKPSVKITMPASENKWYQSYYLPENIDYEYFAREAKAFSFDLNDQLSQLRCKFNCNIEVKATFKDTVKTRLHIEVAEGVSQSIETLGDQKIKTVNFKIKSLFNNQLNGSDLTLHSQNQAIPLILLRMNFL